ncbi:UNVERIFIED_CONTAM: hypothetical protein PYX00_001458 [Menopon gallinae]|uniref:Chitin-binding type-4 domain-containing protein n=1 Tax=Menopon gallinae TaxID=328185 RepID=A0AAW2ICT5_9NEOP
MGRWMMAVFAVLASMLALAGGHGRLIEPPSRATMWRYGFDTPANYNDHELYCGGFSRQWQKNGGKCGICGDAWDMPKPRPHEAGGKYGNGIIVRKYKKGSKITIRVELTANHKGYFEFRLCPNNAPHRVATQECLDLYLLKIAKKSNGGTYGDEPAMGHETRYYPAVGSKVFEMRYQLPENLTCTQCILQWRYIAGNNWGMCPNGTGQVGCGPQEEFRACADVAILDTTGAADETPFDNEIETDEVPKGTKPETGEEEGQNIFIFIAVGTVIVIAGMFCFIYLYFYKRQVVKEWWEQKNISIISRNQPETGFHFWENHKNKLRFWRSETINEKEKNFAIPQPVPPPRTKRQINKV